MPSIGTVTDLSLSEIDSLFFDYVQKELIPAIREDGKIELAEKLERLSQPIQVKGFKNRFLTGLRHLVHGPELEERKNYFLEQLNSSSEDEKSVVNRYVRSQIPGPYYSRVGRTDLARMSEAEQKLAVASAIIAYTE